MRIPLQQEHAVSTPGAGLSSSTKRGMQGSACPASGFCGVPECGTWSSGAFDRGVPCNGAVGPATPTAAEALAPGSFSHCRIIHPSSTSHSVVFTCMHVRVITSNSAPGLPRTLDAASGKPCSTFCARVCVHCFSLLIQLVSNETHRT
jgi:hypothetical protein